MGNVILARMGEVTLKGLNRGNFETQLKHNLKWRLRGFGKLDIYQSQSRIWIEPKEEDNPNFADGEQDGRRPGWKHLRERFRRYDS